ncbi:MAG: molybdenum cofactor biosynthesis protein MoaE [Saprospiraceae bacterium]
MSSDHRVRNIFIQGAISSGFIGEKIADHAAKKNIGGHSIFLGQVRADLKEDKEVTGIEYTSYEEMALEKMHEIRQAIFAKYELTCMHVYHSLGLVSVGEISLFVFASSVHRAPAIEACREVVERIKKELPVWGKELLSDHSHVWKENRN